MYRHHVFSYMNLEHIVKKSSKKSYTEIPKSLIVMLNIASLTHYSVILLHAFGILFMPKKKNSSPKCI